MKTKTKQITITTYAIAEPYLLKIIKWFEMSYGIRISATQALAFSFHTLDTLSKETITSLDKRVKCRFKKYAISSTPQMKEHIFGIIKKSTILDDTALFIASVVVTRALTLPVVPHAKLKQFEIGDSWYKEIEIN
jgi:hypothetical protein